MTDADHRIHVPQSGAEQLIRQHSDGIIESKQTMIGEDRLDPTPPSHADKRCIEHRFMRHRAEGRMAMNDVDAFPDKD
jgi:hypothetical protein